MVAGLLICKFNFAWLVCTFWKASDEVRFRFIHKYKDGGQLFCLIGSLKMAAVKVLECYALGVLLKSQIFSLTYAVFSRVFAQVCEVTANAA